MKAIARAHLWQRMLESGECGSITELAEAEKINWSYVCRVLRPTLLAPDIVQAILEGRQPEGGSAGADEAGGMGEAEIQTLRRF